MKVNYNQLAIQKNRIKNTWKQSLAFQEGLKAHVKITDKDIKAAWDSFHPEVTARIILASSEDEAKEIKKQLDDKGDFAKIAKKNHKIQQRKKMAAKSNLNSLTINNCSF